MSLDVLPSLTPYRHRNSGAINAGASGDRGDRFTCRVALPRGPHEVGIHLRVVMPLSVGNGLGTRAGLVPLPLSHPTFAGHIAVVVGRGSKEEMVRPNTRGVIAAVTDEHAFRYRPVIERPREAMRSSRPIPELELAVSLPATRAAPFPALPEFGYVRLNRPVLVDLGPKEVRDTLEHSLAEPPRKVRGLGSSDRFQRSVDPFAFYHFSAENLNKTTRKAA